MSIFITMKRERNKSYKTELKKEGLKPFSIKLPQLSFHNLEELLIETENLLGIQTSIEQIIKQFIIKLKKINPKHKLFSTDEIVKQFKWNYLKYDEKMELNLITETYKSEFKDIFNDFQKLSIKEQELINEIQILNTNINGLFFERDIISIALDKNIYQDMEFLTQFIIGDTKENKLKLINTIKNIEMVNESIDIIPVDKHNCIYVIYGMKSHENKIISDFLSKGLIIKKLTNDYKSLTDLKEDMKKLKEELNTHTNILYTFMSGNIDVLMNLLLHTIILNLWAETIMVLGLPTIDYECFYLSHEKGYSNELSKLKKFLKKSGIEKLEKATYCQLMKFF